MTRKQVADRLGKSLATVRRIEGVLLHPTVGLNGTHHFDPDEVDDLVRDIKRGRVSLAQGIEERTAGTGSRNAECEQCAEFESQIDELRDQLESQRFRHMREIETLASKWSAERTRLQLQYENVKAALAEFVSAIEDLA